MLLLIPVNAHASLSAYPSDAETDGANGFTELASARGVATFTVGSNTYAIVASATDSGVQIINIQSIGITVSPTSATAGSTITASTSSIGAFSTTTSVPSVSAGSYTISATDGTTSSSTSFTVSAIQSADSTSKGSGRTGLDVSGHQRSENYDPDGFGPGISLVMHQISYDKKQDKITIIASSTAQPINVLIQGGTQRYTAALDQSQPFISEKKIVFSAPLPDSDVISMLVTDRRDHKWFRIIPEDDQGTRTFSNPGYDKYMAKQNKKAEQSSIVPTSDDKANKRMERILMNLKYLNVSEQQKKIYEKILAKYEK